MNIGMKPIFAAGNSDGDYEMLRYVTTEQDHAWASSFITPIQRGNGNTTKITHWEIRKRPG
jgi:hypothetical protein